VLAADFLDAGSRESLASWWTRDNLDRAAPRAAHAQPPLAMGATRGSYYEQMYAFGCGVHHTPAACPPLSPHAERYER
jgi:hypothetical protein